MYPIGSRYSATVPTTSSDSEISTEVQTHNFNLYYSYHDSNSSTGSERLLRVGASMPLTHESYSVFDKLSSVSENKATNDAFFFNPNISFQYKSPLKGTEVQVSGSCYRYTQTLSTMYELSMNGNDISEYKPKNYQVYSLGAYSKFRIGRSFLNASLDFSKTCNQQYLQKNHYYSYDYGYQLELLEFGGLHARMRLGVDVPLTSTDILRLKNTLIYFFNNLSGKNYFEGLPSGRYWNRNNFICDKVELVFRPNRSVELTALGAIQYVARNYDSYHAEDTFNFRLGMLSNFELPWGIQLGADAIMYRSGGSYSYVKHESKLMVNASLTKRFLSGRLLLQFKGYNLFNKDVECRQRLSYFTTANDLYSYLPSHGRLSLIWRF